MTATSLSAADFYIDPVNGSTDNDGTSERPWKSLQSVIDRGLVESQKWDSLPYKDDSTLVAKNPGAPIKAGDTIWLRDGYYGKLNISGFYNSGLITISSEKNHVPHFHSILIRASSNWKINDIYVNPQSNLNDKIGTLLSIDSHSWQGPVHDIIIDNNILVSNDESKNWSADDWNNLAFKGIISDGKNIQISNNHIKNISFGMTIYASHSNIANNIIENFSGDGIRGLGDYGTYEYNVIKNSFDVNDNHDDGFQSWSQTKDGVKGIVLRGNTIINYEDPNQSHRGPLQGIGCFDGMYDSWIVENNLVVTDHWHGISFYGTKNSIIVNNTVMDINDDEIGPPWIKIADHKNGTLSENNTVRNNLSQGSLRVNNDLNTSDHNITVDDSKEYFEDPENHNYQLNQNSPAIDSGTGEEAPIIDINKNARPQGVATDIGAYEYQQEETLTAEEEDEEDVQEGSLASRLFGMN